MKNIFLVLMLVFSVQAFSSIRVMTFNTTCSYACEKGKFDKFKYRKHWIVDTIKRTNPDLIGLQEVFTSSQLHWFQKKLKDYRLIYYRKFFIFRYADPAIFVKRDVFDVKKYGGFWLGPRNGRFSLGWKKRLPRRLQWARVVHKESGQQLYFATSHFDNHEKNKEKSARVFTNAFANVKHPVIFAADTNLKPEMEGFKHLNDYYHDTFDITEKFTMLRNADTSENDSCNLEKGKTFPSCRVDHIMLDKKYNWKVSDWVVDQYKYGKKNRFTSDHRAIYADIELQ